MTNLSFTALGGTVMCVARLTGLNLKFCNFITELLYDIAQGVPAFF